MGADNNNPFAVKTSIKEIFRRFSIPFDVLRNQREQVIRRRDRDTLKYSYPEYSLCPFSARIVWENGRRLREAATPRIFWQRLRRGNEIHTAISWFDQKSLLALDMSHKTHVSSQTVRAIVGVGGHSACHQHPSTWQNLWLQAELTKAQLKIVRGEILKLGACYNWGHWSMSIHNRRKPLISPTA